MYSQPQYHSPLMVNMSPYTSQSDTMEFHEQGQKRNLSFNSNPSPNLSDNDLKRLRHHSLTLGLNQPMFRLPSIPDCYSNNDLLAEIRKIGANALTKSDIQALATKDDLKNIDSKIIAQATEISQLREELDNHTKRLADVEAKLVNQTQLPETTRPNQNTNGGTRDKNNPSSRKYNVVIEGIPKDQNDRLAEYIVELCDALDMTIYTQDILDISRLPRRDPKSTRSPPVLVTFAKYYQRDGLLRKKNKLAFKDTYASIYINPDESAEAQKRKAYFRRVAALAKQDSKDVSFRHNWILIGDDLYMSEDVGKIPPRYCPNDFDTSGLFVPQSNYAGARPKVPTQYTVPPPAISVQMAAPPVHVPRPSTRPPPNEKIRLTKAGPTAYLSNLSPAEFTFDDTPYKSSEQGIQHLNATHHLEFELAETIMKTTNAWRIKSLTENITKDAEWERMEPHKLYELNREKYDQNPELKERLIATAPHRLIEASTSKKWGGGAPFDDEIYDKGIVPGHNKFGDSLTVLRDEYIAKMALS